MKSVFLFAILLITFASCGGSSVETEIDSTVVDTVIVDSAAVGNSLTASDSNTARIPIK